MRRIAGAAVILVGALAPASAAYAYYSGKLTPGNPLAGHRWYVDKTRGSWWVAIREYGRYAAPLRKAANNPMGKTFASFNADPRRDVSNYIARAHSEQPGAIPFINLARAEEGCPTTVPPPGGSLGQYESWMRGFSAGIGRSLVEVVVETDKLAVIGCGTRTGQARRYAEIRYAVHLMHKRNPNAIVYIDAGASDWGSSPSRMAGRLRRADVAEAQGFVVGASHHDWTSKEIRYGLGISRLLGGKHFVVNTNENGRGPRPRFYEPYYHPGCVPPGEGLGILPTVKTPNPHIDAFLWTGTPGFEEGQCLGYGKGSPYTFYLSLALSLVRYANPPLL